MKQIYNKVTVEIEINKSRFITNLIPVSSVCEADEQLALIKKEHYSATHNCFAYVINNQMNQKMSDDGEPSRTAGFPILDTLLTHNLDNVLCVVTRYYGGVKLGKGGLIRAYKNATVEAIKKASFFKEETKQIYEAVIDYALYESFSHFTKNKAVLIDEVFTDEVKIKFYLLSLNILELNNHFHGQVDFIKKDIVTVKVPVQA